jgi:hypothetical protein
VVLLFRRGSWWFPTRFALFPFDLVRFASVAYCLVVVSLGFGMLLFFPSAPLRSVFYVAVVFQAGCGGAGVFLVHVLCFVFTRVPV